ncbi:MAG TPA: CPBP family intramembrane glutamic endopeptidase [Actinoplanes sp.]|jgi:membrane protease YdiL (CAAX protease family)
MNLTAVHPPVAATTRARGFRGWTARHPLTAFLVLAFAAIYPMTSLPILASHGLIPGGALLDRLPMSPDELAGLLLTMFGLLPATLYVTWAGEGREGLRRLLSRMMRWRVGIHWWLLVVAGLPVLTIGIATLLGDPLTTVDPVRFTVTQLGLLAANFFLVNLWEETAWAGFLQTRLERRHNLFVAALVTAVPFGFAHWPLAFFGEVTVASAALGLVPYLVLGVIFRPLLGVYLRGTRDSVLLVALLHSVFNRTNNDNGIAAGLLDGDARVLAMPIAVIVLAAVTAVVIRRRLTRAHRAELDRRTQR